MSMFIDFAERVKSSVESSATAFELRAVLPWFAWVIIE
jgi:hypothetical protein